MANILLFPVIEGVGLVVGGIVGTVCGIFCHRRRGEQTGSELALFHFDVTNMNTFSAANMSVLSNMVVEPLRHNTAVFRNQAHGFEAEGVFMPPPVSRDVLF